MKKAHACGTNEWLITRMGVDIKIKCIHCNSTELEEFNEYYLDGYGSTLMEYSVRCKKCGKTVGHWSCGYWDIY